MSVGYPLVDVTRRERIAFRHLPLSTRCEIAGHPAGAAIVAWYSLDHPGEIIGFVGDHDDWPFALGRRADEDGYVEVTDRTVAALIAAGVLRNDGLLYVDEDEPGVFSRRLTHVWMHCEPAPGG